MPSVTANNNTTKQPAAAPIEEWERVFLRLYGADFHPEIRRAFKRGWNLATLRQELPDVPDAAASVADLNEYR